MRYYLGTTEMKWSHKDRMEQIWIRRELGDELFEEIQQDYCTPVVLRSNSISLPGDTYKRVDVYVDIKDNHKATLFGLRWSQRVILV